MSDPLPAVIAVMTVVLAGCGTLPAPSPLADATAGAAVARQQAIERALVRDAATGELRFVGATEYVILSNFRFTPDQIRLTSGAITRIRLSNSAWVTHYFGGHQFFQHGAELVSLLDSDVPLHQQHIPVAPFTERDIYLFAKAPGHYPLNCFVPNHRKGGMEGVLIVEAAPETELSEPAAK